MPYNFKPRVCHMCGLEYKPTGSAQKFCVSCGKINRREKNLAWYHTKAGREYDREYKRDRRDSIDIDQYITPEEFTEAVYKIMEKQKGNMLSTKAVTRRAMKDTGVYDLLWRQKRNRGGIASRLYAIVESIFRERGGIYWGETAEAGAHYQFPLKKVEK